MDTDRSSRQRKMAFVIVLAAVTMSGCGSLSDSSTSISRSVSNSISSPFESSSRSSSPGEAHRNDVRDFTASYIKSGGEPSNLKTEVGALARKNGITDWENNADTYRGIGAGLAKAGMTEAELEAYKRTVASTEQQAQWMQDGYDGEK